MLHRFLHATCTIDERPGPAARRGATRVPAATSIMTLAEILALALAAVAGWLVWDSLEARETANAAMREACRRAGLLFLDDTVALTSMRPARDGRGGVQLRRVFGFEYSDTGHNRRKGTLTMIAGTVSDVDLGAGSHSAQDGTGPL
jgi:hypothetical protein